MLCLNKIETLILAGGGPLLLKAALIGKELGLAIKVITSPRHEASPIENVSFKKALNNHHIPSICISSLSSPKLGSFVGNMESSLVISLGAPWIFKKHDIEQTFKHRLLNIHGSRLPRDKGGGGSSWNIMQGNRLGACLIHKISEGIDEGDIVTQKEFIYPATCRIPLDFDEHYQKQNLSFLKIFLKKISTSETTWKLTPQSPFFSLYNPRLHTPLNGWINWGWNITDIERFICAFDRPYPGARTRLNGNIVILRNVVAQRESGHFHPFQSGIVFRKTETWIHVAVPGGELIIQSVTDKKGNDLLSKVRLGDRFETTAKDSDLSFQRPIFTPDGLKPGSTFQD